MSKRKHKNEKKRSNQIKASKFEPCEFEFEMGPCEIAAEDHYVDEPQEGQEPSGEKLRKFNIKAYNGGQLSLSNFDHPAYVELSSVKYHGDGSQQPILKEHDSRKLVGHGKPVINASNLQVEDGVISHDNEHSREILAASKKGFQWQASVGGKMTQRPLKIQAGQSRIVNGRNVSGPAYVVRGFLWRETSFCGIGCDDEKASAMLAASVIKGALDMNFEQWLEARGFVAEELSDTQVETLKASFEQESELRDLKEAVEASNKAKEAMVVETAAAEEAFEAGVEAAIEKVEAAAPAPQAPAAPAVDPEIAAAEFQKQYLDKVRETRRNEDRRIAELESLRAEYEEYVPKLVLAELFDKAIGSEIERNKFELELMREARKPKQRDPVHSGSAGPYRRRNFEQSVVEAAMLRSGGMSEDSVAASIRREYGESKVEETMNRATERGMQGFGLHDLIFASIESAGEEIPSRRMNADVIECSMRVSKEIRAAGSATSTVSLPGTLSRIANKQMLQSYEDNLGIWPSICSTADTNDFKQFDSYRLTEAGTLEPVGPSGEIKHTTLGEDSFSNRVINHAKLIGLTEEMMMNDDLGAFQRLSRHFGRMSAHAIEQAVIDTLVNAPSDAGAGAVTDFFRGAALDNSQPNYLTGAASALSVDSLGVAWQQFADQTDREGKPVMMSPKVLLTTTSNAILARNLYNSSEVRIAGTTDRTKEVNNPWAQMFDPIHSAYLSQPQFNGGTAAPNQWYLVAEVSDDFAAIQVAFLNGQRTPSIERFEYDPNMLGVTFRAKLPFGVALQDPRCIVKSDGQ